MISRTTGYFGECKVAVASGGEIVPISAAYSV